MFSLKLNMVEEVVNLALQAGQVIMSYYDLAPEITTKSDNSPVTNADIESDRLICKGLHKLAPDIPIISEESENRKAGGDFWLVDPLDGTKGYARRKGLFTVNIALLENYIPVFGVIYSPLENTVYYGITSGSGQDSEKKAFKAIITNHATWEKWLPLAPDARALSPVRALVSSEKSDQERQWLRNNYMVESMENHSSSIKFCYIADNRADIYPRMRPTYEWDTAAGHAILKAIGGNILDASGQELEYGKRDFLNSHFFALRRLD